MNDNYKKLYDSISPDEKLVEETRQKMLEELEKPIERKNFFKVYGKYISIAACLTIAVASAAIVPSLKNIPISDNNTDSSNAEETTAVSSATEAVTQLKQEEITTIVYNNIDTEKVTEPVNTKTTEPTETEPEMSAAAVSEKIAETKKTVVTEGTTIAENTQRVTEKPYEEIKTESAPSVTQQEVTESVIVEQTVTEIKLPEETTVVTKVPVLRPGAVNTDETYTVSEKVTEGQNGDMPISDNVVYEYERNFFEASIDVSIEEAEEYFGNGIIPESLKQLYPDTTGKAYYNGDYKKGVNFVFGTEAYPEDKSGKCIDFTVGSSEISYGYFINNVDSYTKTAINGGEGTICSLAGTDSVYFCSFEKNGNYFNIMFKGHSYDEILQILSLIN